MLEQKKNPPCLVSQSVYVWKVGAGILFFVLFHISLIQPEREFTMKLHERFKLENEIRKKINYH